MNFYEKMQKIAEQQTPAPPRPNISQVLTTPNVQHPSEPKKQNKKMFGVQLQSSHNAYLLTLKAQTGIHRDIILQTLIEEMKADQALEEKVLKSALEKMKIETQARKIRKQQQ